MVTIALLYCTMSSIVSPNSEKGALFVFEVLLYIPPTLFIALYGDMEKVIGYIHTLVIVHTILLFVQKFCQIFFQSSKALRVLLRPTTYYLRMVHMRD